MPESTKLELFVVSPPGIEAVTATELLALGYGNVRSEAGGCVIPGTLQDVMRTNLWVRTASRVTVRIARFRVTAFHELERLAKQIEWSQYLVPGTEVEFRVTCKKSRLYHSDAVAERFGNALLARMNGVTLAKVTADEDENVVPGSRQRFIVRLFRDECTVSIDSSGELLHRRGYRQAVAKAPLRENLAAAMVLAAQWAGDSTFLDPLCGSGTIPIEAAMIARRLPPGLNRTFAFHDWPGVDRLAWDALVAGARASDRESGVAILATDRDPGAIEATRANAARAGVEEDLQIEQTSLTESLRSAGSAHSAGVVVMNPPYGHRVGEAAKVRDLYAQIGKEARRSVPGWRLALLAAERRDSAHLALPQVEVLKFRNGGIPVTFLVSEVPIT